MGLSRHHCNYLKGAELVASPVGLVLLAHALRKYEAFGASFLNPGCNLEYIVINSSGDVGDTQTVIFGTLAMPQIKVYSLSFGLTLRYLMSPNYCFCSFSGVNCSR